MKIVEVLHLPVIFAANNLDIFFKSKIAQTDTASACGFGYNLIQQF